MADMFLGIESTAHTFAAAVVDGDLRILSDSRSVMPFEEGAGIHPQQAAEHHSDVAPTTIVQALNDAHVGIDEVAGIGYSAGPGLGPSLRIGATAARTMSSCYEIPLYPVHHGVGHIELACQVSGSSDPLVVLVSGGHTAILGFKAGNWRVYGETLDITLGNLLDQFARETGLPFPGGPRVEELALRGSYVEGLPYTVKGNNVVYSGLLTASIHNVEESNLENVSHTLQEVAFAMLTEATERALVQLGKKEIVLTGGVARNSRLQSMIRDMSEAQGGKLLKADDRYDSDNGVQIAVVAALASRVDGEVSIEEATVRQRWRVDEVGIPWRQDIP